jgi:ABC-type lipoprotein release transport system permease subunit
MFETAMRLVAIAFRNLLRSRRRNALSGGTMALGTAALVLGSGLTDGISRQLTSNLVATQTGHLQVVVRPEDFQPQNNPFDAFGIDEVPGATALARRLEVEGRGAGVLRATPYLHARGTALAGNRSSLASIIGILPEREPELRAVQVAEQGTFLPEGDPLAAYIAATAARKLRLGVGDTVSFVVQTPAGAVNTIDAVVCGVFRKGAPWYDNTFYLPLAAAQTLLGWNDGGATNIKIMLADGSLSGARRARAAVRAIVGEPQGLPKGQAVRVETMDEAGRFSFAIVQANQTALAILSTFLFLAAAVGVVNSMLMSVHERTREIGTLRALGVRRSGVVKLFILEGVALGIVSAAVGVALGGAIILYYGHRGIPMNTVSLVWMVGGDALYPILRAGSLVRAAAAIGLLSTLSALYPAYTASRLEPREALHHV